VLHSLVSKQALLSCNVLGKGAVFKVYLAISLQSQVEMIF